MSSSSTPPAAAGEAEERQAAKPILIGVAALVVAIIVVAFTSAFGLIGGKPPKAGGAAAKAAQASPWSHAGQSRRLKPGDVITSLEKDGERVTIRLIATLPGPDDVVVAYERLSLSSAHSQTWSTTVRLREVETVHFGLGGETVAVAPHRVESDGSAQMHAK